jgi:molecular chaperone GrpE
MELVTKQAAESLIIKLLPILDALRQACSFAQSHQSLQTEEIAVGLNMLQKQLLEVLRSEGLEEIQAVGQNLNPERHEVVSYVEKGDEEDLVVEEVRRGYLLNGKVIRPSLVVVSKRKSGSVGAEKGEESVP